MPYTAPSVSNEKVVSPGGSLPAVVAYISVDLPLILKSYTGNNDDGYGIIYTWGVPLELMEFWNLQIYVSGEKVSEEAQLLGLDGTGSLLDNGTTLLESSSGLLIPDLFDGDVIREPDDVFWVETGASQPDATFGVMVAAKTPDQLFNVSCGPAIPDVIHYVRSIKTFQVDRAEPPFMVTVFAEPPDQIFDVISSAVPPDVTFEVTRGPDLPNTIFTTKVITKYNVSTSWAPPDTIFGVTTGPSPAPTPDQIFDVSIGGPDAPPIPEPDVTFNVRVSWAIPSRIFNTKVITEFDVVAYEPPFNVTVGPRLPDQIFDVTSSAPPADQVFAVKVGANIPDTTFNVVSIQEHVVDVSLAPKNYSVSATGSSAYSFTGSGLLLDQNPSLTAVVGQTLIFAISATGHPFWIKSTQGTGAGNATETWASLLINNGTTNNSVYVRFNTPGTYYYNCEYHPTMTGTITVT